MQFARASVEVGAWQDLDGDGRTRSYAQIEGRFGNSSNWDFNLSIRAEDSGRASTVESKMGFSFYW
jgi:hypothetical protein